MSTIDKSLAGLAPDPEPPLLVIEGGKGAPAPITGRSLISGTALNYFGAAVLGLTGFFLTPYMIHSLGRAHYGILALVAALTNYVSLFDLGLGFSVMKLIADAVDHADGTRVNRLLSSVLVAYCVAGACIFVSLMALFPFIRADFHVPRADQGALGWCYLAGVFAVSICFPQAVFTATITAHRSFVNLNRLVIMQALLSAAGTVAALELGYGIITVCVWGAAVGMLGFVVRVLMTRRSFGIGFARRYVNMSVLREVAAFATWMFIVNLAGMVIFDTDTVVVGAILGPFAVTAYQVALSPNTVLQQFGNQLAIVTLTAASALQAGGEHLAVKRLFLESSRVATVLVVPFGICVAAWGQAFIRLWVGARFHSSGPALTWLTVALVEFGIQAAASQTIISYGRHRVLGLALGAEAVANLVVSIWLGKRVGITGVALGTLIPTTFTVTLVTLPYAARLTGSSLIEVLTRVGVPAAEGVGLCFLLRSLVPPRDFSSMLMLVAAGGVVFIGFVCLNLLVVSGERGTYHEYVRSTLRRLVRGASAVVR